MRFCVAGTGRCSEKEFRIEQIHCPPDVIRNQQRMHLQQPGRSAIHCATLQDLEEEKQYDFMVREIYRYETEE